MGMHLSLVAPALLALAGFAAGEAAGPRYDVLVAERAGVRTFIAASLDAPDRIAGAEGGEHLAPLGEADAAAALATLRKRFPADRRDRPAAPDPAAFEADGEPSLFGPSELLGQDALAGFGDDEPVRARAAIRRVYLRYADDPDTGARGRVVRHVSVIRGGVGPSGFGDAGPAADDAPLAAADRAATPRADTDAPRAAPVERIVFLHRIGPEAVASAIARETGLSPEDRALFSARLGL